MVAAVVTTLVIVVVCGGGSGDGGGDRRTMVPMLLPVRLLCKPNFLDALNATSSCVIKINNSATSMQPCQTTLFALLPVLPRFVLLVVVFRIFYLMLSDTDYTSTIFPTLVARRGARNQAKVPPLVKRSTHGELCWGTRLASKLNRSVRLEILYSTRLFIFSPPSLFFFSFLQVSEKLSFCQERDVRRNEKPYRCHGANKKFSVALPLIPLVFP